MASATISMIGSVSDGGQAVATPMSTVRRAAEACRRRCSVSASMNQAALISSTGTQPKARS